jgi:hypothetical protein
VGGAAIEVVVVPVIAALGGLTDPITAVLPAAIPGTTVTIDPVAIITLLAPRPDRAISATRTHAIDATVGIDVVAIDAHRASNVLEARIDRAIVAASIAIQGIAVVTLLALLHDTVATSSSYAIVAAPIVIVDVAVIAFLPGLSDAVATSAGDRLTVGGARFTPSFAVIAHLFDGTSQRGLEL